MMADWNKLEASFELIRLESEARSRSETKYRNSVSSTMESLLNTVNDTTSRIQLLAAGFGTGLDDPDEGPMTLWESIEDLRTSLQRIDGVSDGNNIYLDSLQKTLPNLGTTLSRLATSWKANLPKMNEGLVACRGRLDALERNQPAVTSGLGAFSSNFGAGLGLEVQSYVIQCDFNDLKRDHDNDIREMKALISSLGGAGAAGSAPDPRLDRVLERLGELEGRVTGEAFTMGNFVFCSRTEVADWIVATKVPTAEIFWDLFSVLVCMKPERQTGKDRSDASYSSKRTGSTLRLLKMI
jgi:hypothetical protein